MATLLITYNLNGPEKDYPDLFEAIHGLGECWHDASILDSVWFVKSTMSPNDAVDLLLPHLKGHGYLFVDRVTSDRQGWMPQAFWDWMKE